MSESGIQADGLQWTRLLTRERRRALVGLLAVALLWETLVRVLALPAYVMPTVSAVLAAMLEQRVDLATNAWTTIIEAVSGFVIGCVAGIGIAVL